MDALLRKARYAVRRLVKSPFFTQVAVTSLAPGIGADTAMFSLVNAVILRDLPFESPETPVDVYERREGFSHGTLAYPGYEDLAAGTRDVFTGVSGSRLALIQADAGGGVTVPTTEGVTGNYFALVGVKPSLGRLFTEEDNVTPGAHPLVVLSHAYWSRRFGSDRTVGGVTLRLGGRPYTIIGVAPEAYTGNLRGLTSEVYVPKSDGGPGHPPGPAGGPGESGGGAPLGIIPSDLRGDAVTFSRRSPFPATRRTSGRRTGHPEIRVVAPCPLIAPRSGSESVWRPRAGAAAERGMPSDVRLRRSVPGRRARPPDPASAGAPDGTSAAMRPGRSDPSGGGFARKPAGGLPRRRAPGGQSRDSSRSRS